MWPMVAMISINSGIKASKVSPKCHFSWHTIALLPQTEEHRTHAATLLLCPSPLPSVSTQWALQSDLEYFQLSLSERWDTATVNSQSAFIHISPAQTVHVHLHTTNNQQVTNESRACLNPTLSAKLQAQTHDFVLLWREFVCLIHWLVKTRERPCLFYGGCNCHPFCTQFANCW